MALILFLLRIVVVVLLIRLLARFIGGVIRGYRGEPGPRPATGAPRGSDLVRDTVCNTFVPRDRALVATLDGSLRHFCSTTCRDEALKLARRVS